MQNDYKYFLNSYIDDIDSNIENNYFTPVWGEVTKEISFNNLLDVGCGNGVFSANLKKTIGCYLIGVDGSKYALDEAKKNGFDEVYLVEDLCEESLPFKDESFEIVVCKDVLEHLLFPDKLVKEIFRVLKNNGHFLVHVPNHFTLKGRIKFLFDNDIDPYHWFPNAKRWEFPHLRFYTYESFLEQLHINNFVLIKNLSYHFHSLPYFPGRIRKVIPFRKKIEKKLSLTYPSKFAQGFTVLMKKQVL